MLEGIKNLIFDLGEVIVDVEAKKTADAFKSLAQSQDLNVYSFKQQASFFDDLETGKINNQQFYDLLKPHLKSEVSTQQIETAWNAMLEGIPLSKLNLLLNLQQQFKVFALSNTNAAHIHWCNQFVWMNYGKNKIADYFHKAYYSHDIGYRKPDPKAYEVVLYEQYLKAEETLMLDDRPENLEAAKKLGIKTCLIEKREQVFDIFPPEKYLTL